MRAPMTPAPGSDAAEPPRATSPAARRRSSNAFSSSSPSALAACRSRRSSGLMGLLGLLLRQALLLHQLDAAVLDRKSTRLNSSHVKISYAVLCFEET